MLNVCVFVFRESASIPLIPLGLKETKDVDYSVPFKVKAQCTTSPYKHTYTLQVTHTPAHRHTVWFGMLHVVEVAPIFRQ